MKQLEFDGLLSAPHTPFDASGDVNPPVIEKQAAALVADGVKGAFICGTTGEGVSLTTAERMAVAARWVEVAGKDLRVIVHVGHNSQRDAMALAAHAGEIGAAAIAALPPFFFKPGNVEQAVSFMQPIAAAGGELPFYYYHFPSMSGVSLSVPDFLELGAKRIPNLRGVKFTHSDVMEYQRCRKALDGRFEIAWGFDEMLLGGLALGATSAVGSTYNFAAPVYLRMIEAFRAGDTAVVQECAQHSVEMVSVLLKYGVLRAGKATMAMIGIDCGPTRPPVPPLAKDEIAGLREAYEQIGFFDWARRRV